jgi:hypothetical protein
MLAFCLRVWHPASVTFSLSLLTFPTGGFLISWSGMKNPILQVVDFSTVQPLR